MTRIGACLLLAIMLAAAGCYSPSAANIELRKQNQQLTDQIDQLHRQHEADEATIRGLKSQATTLPTLPDDELAKLFTTSGLHIGRLTGGYRPDPNMPADTMLKVYICPTDQSGDTFKAAGSFHVELFDLALPANNRIGSWDFDLEKSKEQWFSGAFLDEYVLDCPWQTMPAHTDLLARMTFRDELTQRLFTVDREVTVQIGP